MSDEIKVNEDAIFVRELVRQMYQENKTERRWSLFLRAMRTLAFVAIAASVVLIANRPNLLPWSNEDEVDAHAALVFIKGELSADSGASADKIIPALKKAFDEKMSKAVILRINSPGGSAVQAGLIYDEVLSQRQLHPEKQVFAVIDDIGASGGYYIAAAAEQIFANRASLVGSIGVISSGFGFTGLMNKLGIERRTITAGENKAFMDPFLPQTEEIKDFWEGVLAKTHEQFISRVKASRGNKLKTDNPELFSGLIWNGEQAKELGLIDDLKSTDDVAREIVGVSSTIDYTPKQDFMSRFMGKASVQATHFISNTKGMQFSY